MTPGVKGLPQDRAKCRACQAEATWRSPRNLLK